MKPSSQCWSSFSSFAGTYLTLILSVSAFLTNGALGQEAVKVNWPTTNAAPPATLAKPASGFLPLFRLTAPLLPESKIVSLALGQGVMVGLPAGEASQLQSMVNERYRLIQIDPIFRNAPSAVSYCFSKDKPKEGFASIYRPKSTSSQTPCLVFLHGYGGSFLWAQHLLAEAFPAHILVCPAYGISSAEISVDYVTESIKAAERHLGHSIRRPTLIGLSAGGLGASRVYVRVPERFEKLAVLAAYPPPETIALFTRNMSAYFAAGSLEPFVRSGLLQRSVESIRSNNATSAMSVLDGADHFFLLSRQEQTLKLLRSWVR